MLLLEQYEELIERDPIDISYGWKITVVIAYFCCSIASYACSFLFYIFWYEVCGGRCLFWATAKMQPKFENYLRHNNCTLTNIEGLQDWTHQILIYHNTRNCENFELVCMVSCTLSVSFLIIFSICGKGGNDNTLFLAPWRVVLPAISCSLVMTVATMIALHQFTQGYFHFSNQLYQIANEILHIQSERFNISQPCDAVQDYAKLSNRNNFDSYNIYWLTRISAWIMTWSWVVSFLTLCLRILTFVDFTLLKVKVYETREKPASRRDLLDMARKNRASSHLKEIKGREHATRRSKAAKVKVL